MEEDNFAIENIETSILNSGEIKIGSLLSSGKPKTNTSEIKLPICLGGKLITAAICLFNKSRQL